MFIFVFATVPLPPCIHFFFRIFVSVCFFFVSFFHCVFFLRVFEFVFILSVCVLILGVCLQRFVSGVCLFPCRQSLFLVFVSVLVVSVLNQLCVRLHLCLLIVLYCHLLGTCIFNRETLTISTRDKRENKKINY